ncbi:hypothetical protein SUGI_0227810 [Cryptomeria japonica]|uniref:uncharacterized protein LOC131034220 n=1 Tax=Cryptomeria japonica TaxID=3369 RepID=UPI002408EDC2|nr:uncharacterized protein LOC131034220 [Cryptomeria japonica]GLJ14197.1 hypothetical protein SUGI_0227810 [Cryptomeria japonica]
MMNMLGFRTPGRPGKQKEDDAAFVSPITPSTPSSPATTGPARPLKLVYCDEKGKFKMDPEAVATLQLVKGPIGVVSVCGRARQGKSFILNQLLGRSSGFQVASTHRPCTKGLWMWSAPLQRTALDGTEYNLLLLDSEGIDAYDQTGTYSTQIFSLAVLLSSMFVYNQMGGIDEAALDRLSLVTEMTKHIRVRASQGRTTVAEIGQFAPVFVWLLRDFYLNLAEDGRMITPRDYLELALKPMHGAGKDIAAKNEIRESIRALFPDRECFTLVRPLNNEKDLQRLDQIPLDKLRPEFRAGLDALTKFVFERTRPKQVGSTIMTGPILAGLTQSFLDAINAGAVPTIATSWQSVEEGECRRAYELAIEAYAGAFDQSKPPEEGALLESYEGALQKALAVFNKSAVGAGAARQKYEKMVQTTLKKQFEEFKRNAFRDSELKCTSIIQMMDKKLRAACYAPDAKLDQVLKVLNDLVSEYESSGFGPQKWWKLANFLEQSLEGPLFDLTKRLSDQSSTERAGLQLKCRSLEDKLALIGKQLEVSQKHGNDYLKRYEDAISDKKRISDEYATRIANIQSRYSSLEERYTNISEVLESARKEGSDWKKKYEQIMSKQKIEEEQIVAEIASLKSRYGSAEARLSAAREQVESAREEASEWKRKHELAVKEAQTSLEKATALQQRSSKQAQQREDSLRTEFAATIAQKENEVKDSLARLENAEHRLAGYNLQLKAQESKLKSQESELGILKAEIKDLQDKLEDAKQTALSFEKEAKILEQEKSHLQQRYATEFKRFEEADERCKAAEKEAKRAVEVAEKARDEAAQAQQVKSEIQKLAMERLTIIERSERHIETLEREKADLVQEVERIKITEQDALSKVATLEARVDEREREMEDLLQSTNEQRASTVQVLESLLGSERAARAEANARAEALSLQLQTTQGKLDALQQELTSVRLNETALDNKLKTTSARSKRMRSEDYAGVDSVQDMDIEVGTVRDRKRRNASNENGYSPVTMAPEGDSVIRPGDDNNSSDQREPQDYLRFTVQKLKQELTKSGFGAELLQLRTPNKKEILALYEKHVLKS